MNDKTSSNGGGSGEELTAEVGALRAFIAACAAIPNEEEACYDLSPEKFTELTFAVHDAADHFITVLSLHGEKIAESIGLDLSTPDAAVFDEARVTVREGDVSHNVVIGEGVAADFTGAWDEAIPSAQLPEKVPGKHRWVVTAAYTVDDAVVGDDLPSTFLDHESLFTLALGCWDCEQQYPKVTADSECPA